MATDKIYLDWIRAGLGRAKGKTQKGLAAALGIDPSGVTKLLQGKRELQLSELPVVATYLGTPVPVEPGGGVGVGTATAGVQNVSGRLERGPTAQLIGVTAVIASAVWRENEARVRVTKASQAQAVQVPASADSRLVNVKQYACAIEGEPDRFLICAPYSAVRPQPRDGDVVHVRRTAGTLHEDTVRTVRINGGQIRLELQDNSGNAGERVLPYPSRKGSEKIAIEGLVVGEFRAYRF